MFALDDTYLKNMRRDQGEDDEARKNKSIQAGRMISGIVWDSFCGGPRLLRGGCRAILDGFGLGFMLPCRFFEAMLHSFSAAQNALIFSTIL